MKEVERIYINQVRDDEVKFVIEQLSRNKFLLLARIPLISRDKTEYNKTVFVNKFYFNGLLHIVYNNNKKYKSAYLLFEDIEYKYFARRFIPILTSSYWIYNEMILFDIFYKKERINKPEKNIPIYYSELQQNDYSDTGEKVFIISNSERVLKRFIEHETHRINYDEENDEDEEDYYKNIDEIDEIYFHMTQPPLVFRLVENFDTSFISNINLEDKLVYISKQNSIFEYILNDIQYQDFIVKTISNRGCELFENDTGFVGFNQLDKPYVITNFKRVITELSIKPEIERINYLTSDYDIGLILNKDYIPFSIYAFDEVAFNKFKKLCKKEGVKVKKI